MCQAASSPPTRPFSDDRVSLGFPLFPLDPRDQLGTPLLPVERLGSMGRRALEHQVVGGAATPQPKPARGPHVVELGLSETLVEDPRPGEDARGCSRVGTLGHSQISLMLNRYSHVIPTLGRAAAEQMDAVLAACSDGSATG
jgi:hypothetical protein